VFSADHHMRGYGLPAMYVWDVHILDLGPGGVSGSRDRAIRDASEALRDSAPGARATIREVDLVLDQRLQHTVYRDLRTICEARRDADTGAVVWTEPDE